MWRQENPGIRADLGAANLSRADLSAANLSAANLSGARLWRTNFTDIDLQNVKGLEEVHHSGPSRIGIDTLYASGGDIPEAFLRGCGVPGGMIAYAKSLVSSPIEFYS